MKKLTLLILLLGLFTSCTKDEEPPIVFENVRSNLYNSSITEESYYQNWDFLKPEITIEKSPVIKEIVYYGNAYTDSITFTIRGTLGVLSVVTKKQEITSTYETYTKTLTFHAVELEYYSYRITVTQDGIFKDNELIEPLSNFELKETYSKMINTETKQVQTTFTGETHQANSESFTIGKGNEEYKLTYLSANEIEVSQTQPIQREIGTIDRK